MLAAAALPDLDAIDVLLPQTQCQRCGYADCRAYASAMHSGTADINRCPPGGEATGGAGCVAETAWLPLADDVDAYAAEHVARIDEAACIGCAACLPVCPTDAIVGASKRMHTVIAAGLHRLRTLHHRLSGRLHRAGPCGYGSKPGAPSLTARAHSRVHCAAKYLAHQRRYTERAEAKAAAHVPKPTTAKQALLADILARAKARAAVPPRS